MPKQKQITRQAILKRIAEIDAKFQATEGWLHPTLSKLARERELLVEQANEQFKVGLKHEWRWSARAANASATLATANAVFAPSNNSDAVLTCEQTADVWMAAYFIVFCVFARWPAGLFILGHRKFSKFRLSADYLLPYIFAVRDLALRSIAMRHSWRIDPISRSAKPFCQGEAGAI
jgi:hypothetical protein